MRGVSTTLPRALWVVLLVLLTAALVGAFYLFRGDSRGTVYAYDAADQQRLWRRHFTGNAGTLLLAAGTLVLHAAKQGTCEFEPLNYEFDARTGRTDRGASSPPLPRAGGDAEAHAANGFLTVVWRGHAWRTRIGGFYSDPPPPIVTHGRFVFVAVSGLAHGHCNQ